MRIRIVTRLAITALSLLIVWAATPRAGIAQQCRRTCESGEARDVRGCCVPKAVPEPARPAPKPAPKPAHKPDRSRRPEHPAREQPRRETPAAQPSEPPVSKPSLPPGATPEAAPTARPGPRTDQPTPEPRRTDVAPGMLAEPQERAPEPRRRWPVWMPWAVAGAGAVLTVTGGILRSSASGTYESFDSEFDRLCLPYGGCHDDELPQYLWDQLDRAQRLETTSRVLLVTGGLTIAAGAALVFMNQTMNPTSERTTARTFLVPTVGPHAAGIAAGISF